MLIKEETFRNLFKTLIIIKDKNQAQEMAKYFNIESIMEDDISDEELQQIFDYVTEHLEVLLEFWESDGKQDGKALYKKLRLYGEK